LAPWFQFPEYADRDKDLSLLTVQVQVVRAFPFGRRQLLPPGWLDRKDRDDIQKGAQQSGAVNLAVAGLLTD
jgi:hypothetical protein